MSGLRLFLLGPPRLEREGVPLQLQYHKNVALVAYLAVTSGHHAREALVTLLWPELEPSRARAGLRRNLSVLQKALGGQALVVDRETVGLAPGAGPGTGAGQGLWLDVDQFHLLLSAWRGHGHPESEVCPACLAALSEAVELYRGDFMAGFSLRDSVAFDEWQLYQTEGLRQELSSVLQRLVRGLSARGSYEPAIPYARRLLSLDPWHEPAHQELMRLLALNGQRSAALTQYEACARALREELGVEPAPETVDLYQAIRAHRPLPAAEPVEAAAPSGLPPAPSHNLPGWLTPFVGRQDLLAEIQRCLHDPACRLLTLIGPGGSGKTRLAVEAARACLSAPASFPGSQLPAFPHGVWFVSLAAIQSTDAIVPAVAQAIGFSFRREGEVRQQRLGEARQQLLDYLRQKRMLLLLDNMEHLLDGADVATGILQAAPGIKVLVTSRAALNVGGEQLLPVPGMSYPQGQAPELRDAATAAQYSAVQLFVQAARRVRPGLEPAPDEMGQIVALCQLVQGMPLALLLAAAWMRALSAGEIVAEVRRSLDFLETDRRDLPERQRSVRAAFDHSWRLLSEREQAVFAALAAFRGGFTRQAAQEVAGADLRALASLANKSFLQRDRADRYQVHELLRQYGEEKLRESPEVEARMRDRHSAYYSAALEWWAAGLKGPRQRAALGEIDLEIDNVRAAWNWAVGQGSWSQLAQAAEGLGLYYDRRWRRQEGAAAFQQAAEGLEAVLTAPAPASAGALQALLQLLARQGSFVDDDSVLSRVACRCQELLARPELAGQDVRRERALVLLHLSRALAGMDDVRARLLYEEGLALYRELGDRWAQADLLGKLALSDSFAGNQPSSVRLLEESLALFRTAGDWSAISTCLFYLSIGYRELEQFEETGRAIEEQTAIARQTGDRTALMLGFDMQGGYLWVTGQFGKAVEVHEKGYMPLLEELGDRDRWAQAKAWLARFKLDSGEYAPVRALAEESLAIGRELNSQLALYSALPVLAKVAMLEERYLEALQLYHETLEFGKEHGALWIGVGYRGELAVAELRLGNAGQARQELREALHTAASRSVGTDSMRLLPPAAEFLAHEYQPERAVEVYALALRYPYIANSHWYQDVFGPRMAAVAAALPPEAVQAAQARGRARDLEATVGQLLAAWER